MAKSEMRQLIRKIERLLNAEVPGTPAIGGRVRYVALPGSGRKSRLSRTKVKGRPAEVLAVVRAENGRAEVGTICEKLGLSYKSASAALHQLRRMKLVESRPLEAE